MLTGRCCLAGSGRCGLESQGQAAVGSEHGVETASHGGRGGAGGSRGLGELAALAGADKTHTLCVGDRLVRCRPHPRASVGTDKSSACSPEPNNTFSDEVIVGPKVLRSYGALVEACRPSQRHTQPLLQLRLTPVLRQLEGVEAGRCGGQPGGVGSCSPSPTRGHVMR
jgi:hypothetical protein